MWPRGKLELTQDVLLQHSSYHLQTDALQLLGDLKRQSVKYHSVGSLQEPATKRQATLRGQAQNSQSANITVTELGCATLP